MDSFDNIGDSSMQSLARLFDADDSVGEAWTGDDLASIWRHQCSLPAAALDETHLLTDRETSLGDLLSQSSPSLELLEFLKAAAKRQGREAAGLPEPVARALYIAAIAAARLRCGERITSDDDETLARRVRRVLEFGWLDDTTRELLLALLGQVEPTL